MPAPYPRRLPEQGIARAAARGVASGMAGGRFGGAHPVRQPTPVQRVTMRAEDQVVEDPLGRANLTLWQGGSPFTDFQMLAWRDVGGVPSEVASSSHFTAPSTNAQLGYVKDGVAVVFHVGQFPDRKIQARQVQWDGTTLTVGSPLDVEFGAGSGPPYFGVSESWRTITGWDDIALISYFATDAGNTTRYAKYATLRTNTDGTLTVLDQVTDVAGSGFNVWALDAVEAGLAIQVLYTGGSPTRKVRRVTWDTTTGAITLGSLTSISPDNPTGYQWWNPVNTIDSIEGTRDALIYMSYKHTATSEYRMGVHMVDVDTLAISSPLFLTTEPDPTSGNGDLATRLTTYVAAGLQDDGSVALFYCKLAPTIESGFQFTLQPLDLSGATPATTGTATVLHAHSNDSSLNESADVEESPNYRSAILNHGLLTYWLTEGNNTTADSQAHGQIVPGGSDTLVRTGYYNWHSCPLSKG